MSTVKESKGKQGTERKGGQRRLLLDALDPLFLLVKAPRLNTGGFTQEPFPNIINPLPSAAKRTSVGLRLALNSEIRLRERCDLSIHQ